MMHMKKTLSSLLSTIFIFSLLPFPTVSAERLDLSNVMTTVQIISYEYTRNKSIKSHGAGSATIIRKDGLILTNNHVVVKSTDEEEALDTFSICMTLNGQAEKEEPDCEYTASLIARNEDLDLALLKINSRDIRGNILGDLPFLSYTDEVTIESGDPIKIIGYPGIGGETVTVTEGTVSGFEDQNGANYIKTDTDIAPGNSGGTVLDKDGKFIGIPTYLVSAGVATIGRFLDKRDAEEWINENKNKQPFLHNKANLKLAERRRLFNDANDTFQYTHPFYPAFDLEISADWEYTALTHDTVVVSKDEKYKSYTLSISTNLSPVPYTEEMMMEKFYKKIEKQRDSLNNFKKEDVVVGGKEGVLMSYDYSSTKSMTYIVPYGHALFTIRYQMDLKEEEKEAELYEAILQHFKITDEVMDYPERDNYITREDPPFSVSTPVGWHMLENMDPRSDELIVSLEQTGNYEGQMVIYYDKFTESEKKMSAEDLLDEVLDSIEYQSGFRLINKNSDVNVGGLDGFSITYVYEGEEYGQTRKKSIVYLMHDTHYYTVSYDDIDNSFDVNENDFKILLRSFRNLDPDMTDEGKSFQLGSLNAPFKDITYHRFEREISNLRDKEIVNGYEGGMFYPERKVSRLETFLIMMRARKKFLEEQNNPELEDELAKYVDPNPDLDFSDVDDEEAKQYLRYARDKGFTEGYERNRFYPNRNVTLAQALKLLIEIFEIPVWKTMDPNANFPWYKPYIYKAYEMGIIPKGISLPEYEITRAELSAITVYVMERVE